MLAMSTSKVLILSALLLDKGGPSGLSGEERSLAQTAITESDNDSILSLFSDLEADKGGLDGASTYATGLLRAAGDHRTVVTTAPAPRVMRQASARLRGHRLMRSVLPGAGARVRDPTSSANYELGLMRQIVPSESWGMGTPAFPRSRSRAAGARSPAATASARQRSSAPAVQPSWRRSLRTRRPTSGRARKS